MRAKDSKVQFLRFILISFLFVPVKPTEITGDISGYGTTLLELPLD